MRLVVDLTLPSEARLISRTRRVFSGYLEVFGASQETVSDVVLAVDEACTNVVRHAFDGAPVADRPSFRLTAELSDDEVVVVIEDDGVGMPIRAIDLRPLDAAPDATSGRGLQIIRELMTSVDIETEPDRRGTRLEMRKDLRV
jgi:serine/threonine-protein kinase RsbW